MSKLKSFLGGGPKVDNSGAKRQEALIAKQEDSLRRQEDEQRIKEEEQKKKLAAAKRARTGGADSLLSGLETGVSPTRRETLG
jgi:hypothetical protein